jgi:lipopolysaccharide biosynthesis glycosyltransferase
MSQNRKHPIRAILFAFDQSFFEPGLVSVFTALRHSPDDVPVFVASLGLSQDSANRVLSLAPQRLKIVDVTERINALASQLPGRRLVPATKKWARILVDQIVPSDIQRVLYLDADILVRNSLLPLLESDLHGKMIGACVDHLTTTHGQRGVEFCDLAQSPPTAAYFNSGVLVLDLHQWRGLGADMRILEVASKQPTFKFPNQDLLNVSLWRDWYPLDGFTWNFPAAESRGSAHASILHFVGPKPWKTPSINRSSQREYELAAKEIGWNLKLPFKLRLKEITRWFLPTGYTNHRYSRIEPRYSFELSEGL